MCNVDVTVTRVRRRAAVDYSTGASVFKSCSGVESAQRTLGTRRPVPKRERAAVAKRAIIVNIATSADGFVARPDGDMGG